MNPAIGNKIASHFFDTLTDLGLLKEGDLPEGIALFYAGAGRLIKLAKDGSMCWWDYKCNAENAAHAK